MFFIIPTFYVIVTANALIEMGDNINNINKIIYYNLIYVILVMSYSLKKSLDTYSFINLLQILFINIIINSLYLIMKIMMKIPVYR